MDARIQTKMEKKEKVLFQMAVALNRRLQLMGSSEHSMLSFHLTQLDSKTMETFNASSSPFLKSSLKEAINFPKGPESSIGSEDFEREIIGEKLKPSTKLEKLQPRVILSS